MVLSTTEMKPRANIAGIQARSLTFDDLEMPKLTTITSSAQASQQAFDVFSRTAATCNSLRPNQLILAVPASETRVERGSAQPPAPFLQTFDMSTSHHISRQAATRNNVTNFNVGPEGLKLQEPDIKMLQVTRDGKWLATIEEWIPPTKDVAFLAADDVAMHEAQCQRREVYLKFWRWDAKDQRLLTVLSIL
ncbi:NET1-associated nuclear protein 1 [Cryomyces antarcticus]|nr:NET1-associated nuclear protein 1 [Cryomyces antarcticus]